jgi:alanine dehydrogenase
MEKIKMGVLRETKFPPDRRTALAPDQAVMFQKQFPGVELRIESSFIRAYSDDEYRRAGLQVVDSVDDCQVLVGVKEVEVEALLEGKTYLFFSHTAKKQEFNKELLRAMVQKRIQMVDYEYLTNAEGVRLVAFGRWAGIMGTYNGLLGYGHRSRAFDLKRAHECYDMHEVHTELKKVRLPNNFKIAITGGGRVAHGAMEILDFLGIRKVTAQQLVQKQFDEPVYSQIDPWHYTRRRNGDHFDLQDFFKHPHVYDSAFEPYAEVADLYITAHFWTKGSPNFITPKVLANPKFRIGTIADISCDLNGPMTTTLRASTIDKPFYGYHRASGTEGMPFDPNCITVMAVDNLPGEAPRATSVDFGLDLLERVFPSLFGTDPQSIIARATICRNGALTPAFAYLQNWLDGTE